MDIQNINALIAALRAEVAKDSVSPDSLGAILQAIANALADVASPADIKTLRDTLFSLFPANPLGEKYPRSALNIMPQTVELSSLDDIPAVKTKSFLAGTKYQTEYLVTEGAMLMGRLFLIADSMNHAVTQVLISHQLLTPDGKLDSAHGQALRIYFRRYNLTEHHGTPGEWSPWTEYIPVAEVQRLGKNVLDLGAFESEEAALLAAKLTEVSADSKVSLIRFSWDNGKKNGFILQQVGSQTDQNICDTYQFYSYGGRCWYRLIQWYYADDDKGHKARDFYTATAWKSPFGNTLRYYAPTRTLQLLSWKNELVSETQIPSDKPLTYVASIALQDGQLVIDYIEKEDVDTLKIPLPTLQTAWNTGTEKTYIYSKPWAIGADNSKTVLAVGSHVAQHGGKLKMRYIFWGGGSGAAYGNEVPVATATCDGAMSAADKAAIDDLSKRFKGTSTQSTAFSEPQFFIGDFSGATQESWRDSWNSINQTLDSLATQTNRQFCGWLYFYDWNNCQLKLFNNIHFSGGSLKVSQLLIGCVDINSSTGKVTQSADTAHCINILRRYSENGTWSAWEKMGGESGSYILTVDTGSTVTTEQINAIKEAFNNGRGVMVVIPSAGLKFQAAIRQKTDQDNIYLSGCIATPQDGFQLAFAKINILSHAVTFSFKNI